jgi:hypothetical protein
MKERQDRIDCNSVNDLELDRTNMIEFLTNSCSKAELIVMKEHYEKLIDHKILKLESSLWLILIYKVLYQKEQSNNKVING